MAAKKPAKRTSSASKKMAADDRYDRKRGIKENSARDKKIDRSRGVK